MEHRLPVMVGAWFRMKRYGLVKKNGKAIGNTNGKRRAPTREAGCYAPLIRDDEAKKDNTEEALLPYDRNRRQIRHIEALAASFDHRGQIP